MNQPIEAVIQQLGLYDPWSLTPKYAPQLDGCRGPIVSQHMYGTTHMIPVLLAIQNCLNSNTYSTLLTSLSN